MKHIDKLYHFIAGMIIFWVASYFMACPIIPVIVIGATKEIYDRVIRHNYADFWDFLATVAGGILIWVVM